MKINFLITCVLLLSSAISCRMEGNKNNIPSKEKNSTISEDKGHTAVTEMNKGDSLIAKAVKAHGGNLYDSAHYGFRFRKNSYTFQNREASYIYTSTGKKDGEEIRDVIKDGTLTRTVNGRETELSPKDITKYTEALNSVIYFATLPYKLQDDAVNKSYMGQQVIEGQKYDVISVTFDKKGGGTDYDDAFLYWLHTETHTIDYLAYSYATNDGGVRFRSAYNQRTVGGILFQDYVNYEAPLGTALNALPKLFEAKKLKELSRIKTENVMEINN